VVGAGYGRVSEGEERKRPKAWIETGKRGTLVELHSRPFRERMYGSE